MKEDGGGEEDCAGGLSEKDPAPSILDGDDLPIEEGM